MLKKYLETTIARLDEEKFKSKKQQSYLMRLRRIGAPKNYSNRSEFVNQVYRLAEKHGIPATDLFQEFGRRSSKTEEMQRKKRGKEALLAIRKSQKEFDELPYSEKFERHMAALRR